MEKELKRLVIEVIVLTIFLIITVPICVQASSNYNKQKETILNTINITIDVNNKKDEKEITLYNNSNKQAEIKLGLKISQFYDQYYVTIDNKTYNLNELDYKEDKENKYIILGTYKIDKVKTINFKLTPKKQDYFKENLIYSFYKEGTLENGRL